MHMKLVQISILIIFSSIGFSSLAFGQGVATMGGVDVDGSWYLGEGLKIGDYFEYSLCQLDLNDCSPIKLKMWIKGEIPYETETLWDTEVVIIDGDKIIKGSWGLGKMSPEPITFDDDVFDYAIAFKSSLAWLGAFATGNEDDRVHGPQEFKATAWGKIGAIGGAQLTTTKTETIIIPTGTVDTVVVGWYSGEFNEIWIVDEFPFPVKALTYAWVTTGIAPIMHQYTLLDFKENVTDDPFQDVVETISKEDLLDCPIKFYNYTSDRVATNTFSMIIQYNYSPEFPIEGCNIDWKINFMNKYNDIEFVDQVHYDILVVDDDGNKLRSYAEDLGRDELFNGFGQVHVLLPIEEKAGLVHYIIFVHGTGPEHQVPDALMGGYIAVDIQIDENPLLQKSNNAISPSTIPSWIKNNAGWWADNQIDDTTFVLGIQFMIENKILDIQIQLPNTSDGNSQEIPTWVKNNAGWWADGLITEDDFIKGIQYLVENQVIQVN